jgi:cytochrome c oxidase accessory protein FixG
MCIRWAAANETDRGALGVTKMDGGVAQSPAHAPEIDSAVSIKTQKATMPLYASRIKVHPKNVSGLYRNIKWGMLVACLAVYYIAPWLRWDRGPFAPDQAILIDLPGRRAYFFFLEIWPQEVYFLTGILVLAAFGLFLATALFGRIWCGYACPQTVWTDLFMLVERWIEGDRNARIRLDEAPASFGKFAKRAAKHASWIVLSLATGGACILFFGDAPTLLVELFTGRASASEYFFAGLFATTTYVLAGFAREQVCTYMCPWPRFQSAMLDDRSYVVTYEGWRGEPRGRLAKKPDGSDPFVGRGDCVDCNACVATCPTGIDIRDGQQLECIGCGLCIDACNAVMDKVGRPRSLIRFDTLDNQRARAEGGKPVHRLIRARTVLYTLLLAVVGSIMLAGVVMRTTVELTVQRDRNPLFVRLVDGSVRNAYTVHVLNKTHASREYALTLEDLPGARLSMVGGDGAGDRLVLSAKPDQVASYRVFVTLPAGEATKHESTHVEFKLRASDGRDKAERETVFIAPPR